MIEIKYQIQRNQHADEKQMAAEVKIKARTVKRNFLRRLYDEPEEGRLRRSLPTYIAHFTDYIGKHLPDDVKAKISGISRGGDKPACKVHPMRQ